MTSYDTWKTASPYDRTMEERLRDEAGERAEHDMAQALGGLLDDVSVEDVDEDHVTTLEVRLVPVRATTVEDLCRQLEAMAKRIRAGCP